MSRVTVDSIAVGEACTITSPNSTTASLATATAAVDDENLRLEGIDRRNLGMPGAGLARVVQFPSGSIPSPAATPQIVQSAMLPCPPVTQSSGSGGQIPEIVVGVQNAAFVIVRLSCEMKIEGSGNRWVSTARESTGKVGLGISDTGGAYVLADETLRSWQLGNIPNDGASHFNQTRQSIHIFYVHHVTDANRNNTYKYTPLVGVFTSGTGSVLQNMFISNINLSAVVYLGL